MLNADKRIHILLEKIYGALAERFMQRTFNPYKVGSIPTDTTIFISVWCQRLAIPLGTEIMLVRVQSH